MLATLACTAGLAGQPVLASDFDVRGTIFDRAASRHGVDPVLLYSVALAESAYKRDSNFISPWLWTLRSSEGARYLESQELAEQELSDLISRRGKRVSVDIGPMQVNLYWQGHRVDDPLQLLDVETNFFTGAEILAEALSSAPGDPELGVGRYHNWEEELRARTYGRRVLSIYRQLTGQHFLGGGPTYASRTN